MTNPARRRQRKQKRCPHGTEYLVEGTDGKPKCIACVHESVPKDLQAHCCLFGDDDDGYL